MIDKRIKKSPQEIAYALNGTLSLAERKLLKRMLSFLAIFEQELLDLKSEIINLSEPFKESVEIMSSIPGLDVLSSLYILGEIGQKKSIIAVARKLLVYIYMILSSKSPYNTKLDMT